MYKLLKAIYFAIPAKGAFFKVVRRFYTPSPGLASYLKFRGKFSVEINPNVYITLYNDDSTIPSLLFWNGLNSYEQMSLSIWKNLSKNSSGILDVGANIGIFGLIAQKINPGSRVVLFEPLERNVRRIKRNFRLNNLEPIVEQVAVSDFNGTATFYDMSESENTIGSFDKSFVESHTHHAELIPIQVPVQTLDSYVRDKKLPVVDLVKIDVEGADFEVMKGFAETIEKFKPTILIEVTNSVSSNKITEFLGQLSFTYNYYEVDEESGLIKRNRIQRGKSRNYLLSCKELAEL